MHSNVRSPTAASYPSWRSCLTAVSFRDPRIAQIEVIANAHLVAEIDQDAQLPHAGQVEIDCLRLIGSGNRRIQEHIVVAANHQADVALRPHRVVDAGDGLKPGRTSPAADKRFRSGCGWLDLCRIPFRPVAVDSIRNSDPAAARKIVPSTARFLPCRKTASRRSIPVLNRSDKQFFPERSRSMR